MATAYKVAPVASPLELTQLNSAIVVLSKAKSATSEKELVDSLSEAFRTIRQITRSRVL